METPINAHTPTSHPLHLLLSHLFLHFIPTVFLGIISLVLTEAARIVNHAAYLCQTPRSPKPTSHTTSPLTEPNNFSNTNFPPTPPSLSPPPHPPSLSLSPPIRSTKSQSTPPPPPPPPLQYAAPYPTQASPPPRPPSSPPPSSPSLSSPPLTSPPLSPPLSPSQSHPRSPPRSPLPSPPTSPPPRKTHHPQPLSSPYYQSSSLHVSVSSAPTSPPPAPTPPPRHSPFHPRQPSFLMQTPPQRFAPSPNSQNPTHPPELPSTLVAKRVSDYETFIAGSTAHPDQPLRLPFPSHDTNDSVQPLSTSSSKPSVTSSSTKVPHSFQTENDRTLQSQSPLETHHESDFRPMSEFESESESESQFESDTHVSEPPFLHPSGQSGDIQTLVAPTDSTSSDGSEFSTTEAPGGHRSLQELIPDDVPPSFPHANIDDSDVIQVNDAKQVDDAIQVDDTIPVDDTIQVDDAIQVDDTMGEMSPLRLSRNGSITSLRTESYSSPDSQSQSNSYKNRKSWRGSDHDFFSEEPIMTFESIEQFNAEGQEPKVGTGSSQGNSDLTRRSKENTRDGRSNRKNVRRRRSFSFEEDMQVAESIQNIVRDNPALDFGNSRAKDTRGESKNVTTRRMVPDSKLFRQASVDLPSINTATFLVDRPRPGSVEPARFLPNRFAGLRFSRTPSVGHTPTTTTRFNSGPRSQSSAETHFEDWPEYTPSGEEDEDSPALSRRHASDMSYGVKARRQDMLPVELLGDPGADQHILDESDSIFDKLGAKAWKRRFVRHSLKKDDAKGMMRNILRRKRKVSSIMENEAGFMSRSESYRRGGERSNGLSAREREFTFECELDQSDVFSLLERLCPECGYRVVVRRPTHKVKIEVPCEGDERDMLLSISLTRIANGQNTVVTVSRSKDDLSDGYPENLEAAGSILQKRLAGQVEFIEDSFASLDFAESAIDVADRSAR